MQNMTEAAIYLFHAPYDTLPPVVNCCMSVFGNQDRGSDKIQRHKNGATNFKHHDDNSITSSSIQFGFTIFEKRFLSCSSLSSLASKRETKRTKANALLQCLKPNEKTPIEKPQDQSRPESSSRRTIPPPPHDDQFWEDISCEGPSSPGLTEMLHSPKSVRNFLVPPSPRTNRARYLASNCEEKLETVNRLLRQLKRDLLAELVEDIVAEKTDVDSCASSCSGEEGELSVTNHRRSTPYYCAEDSDDDEDSLSSMADSNGSLCCPFLEDDDEQLLSHDWLLLPLSTIHEETSADLAADDAHLQLQNTDVSTQ